MSPTDIAAWWGAGVATLVFLWDIAKWILTGRPKLDLRILKNMERLPPGQSTGTYLIVEVANNGDRATTVNLVSLKFSDRRPVFFRKSQWQGFYVNQPGLSHPLPYVLEPGKTWAAQIHQNAELEKMAKSGYLYCQVWGSHRKNPTEIQIIV